MNNPILEFRKNLGVSQSRFAELVSDVGPKSIGQAAVSNYEINYRTPARSVAVQIATLAKKHRYTLSLDTIYEHYSVVS